MQVRGVRLYVRRAIFKCNKSVSMIRAAASFFICMLP